MINQKGNVVVIVLLILVGLIALSAIGMALNIITIPWLKLGKQFKMERDIVADVYDADNAIYNYEWFKNRHENILATEVKIGNANQAIGDFRHTFGPATDWTFEDKTEFNRLGAVKLGLENHFEGLVAEYNARSKQANRAIFKDDLPLIFELEPF